MQTTISTDIETHTHNTAVRQYNVLLGYRYIPHIDELSRFRGGYARKKRKAFSDLRRGVNKENRIPNQFYPWTTLIYGQRPRRSASQSPARVQTLILDANIKPVFKTSSSEYCLLCIFAYIRITGHFGTVHVTPPPHTHTHQKNSDQSMTGYTPQVKRVRPLK